MVVVINAISDLHGILPEIKKECDVLAICGDILPLDIQTHEYKSKKWLREKFKPWAENLEAKKVLFIAGNHDFLPESEKAWMYQVFLKDEKVTYLCDDEIEISGIRFYGTPWCKIFGSWAFMREPEILEKKFSEIPENIDILLTHDAPYGVSDICEEDVWWNTHEHIGNLQLRDAILEKKPKYNLHGHLHSSSHLEEILGETKVYNVSLVGEDYKPHYEIHEIKL